MQETLQTLFLQAAKDKQVNVTMFLVNGFQLRGTIKDFDTYAVVLDSENKQQLIYKHAISTIVPQGTLEITKEVAG